MKIKLFTHTDLDGVGCAILAKIAFNKKEDIVDIEYCNYDDINEKVEKFITSNIFTNFDAIYITDISVGKDVAELINNTECNTYDNGYFNLSDIVQLLDHHPTAEWLNNYDWATVNVNIDNDDYVTYYEQGVKSSGTQMFYTHLQEMLDYENVCEDELVPFNEIFGDMAHKFTEHVRQYDTWEWSTIYNNDAPKKLNDLLYLYGRDRFIEKYTKRMSCDGYLIDDYDLFLLQLNQEKIDKYIESKQKQIVVKDVLGYKAGIVFAEQYASELGNKLSVNNPHLDFIAIINPSHSVSYRTIKDNIDLGKDIAKVFGGRGHPKAAGSEIRDEFRNDIIDMIFEL